MVTRIDKKVSWFGLNGVISAIKLLVLHVYVLNWESSSLWSTSKEIKELNLYSLL
jgi:hypothetical protein